MPNRLDLKDGSYILWDKQDEFYRVALYKDGSRKPGKSKDLSLALSHAMRKKPHDRKLREIATFIERSAY